MKTKVLTIKKIRFRDKWAEFWFEEETSFAPILDEDYLPTKEKYEVWLLSSKVYRLWLIVDNADLYNHIMNNGFKGLHTKWGYYHPNWEIESIYL